MSGTFLPLRPLARYADFKGRSGRGEFWAFQLLIWIVYGALYTWVVIPLIPVFQGQTPDSAIFIHLLTSLGLLTLIGLLLFLPVIAVQVRRLHDSNRTGWWVLLPTAFSMVGQQLVYIFQGEAVIAASMKASEAVEAISGPAFDFARLWDAYLPLYRITLPWAFGPSLVASLVLLVFYLWPGNKGENRFGPNPRPRLTT
jgi:uncharacterized membrane protein YhaH (DUF805 family)